MSKRSKVNKRYRRQRDDIRRQFLAWQRAGVSLEAVRTLTEQVEMRDKRIAVLCRVPRWIRCLFGAV